MSRVLNGIIEGYVKFWNLGFIREMVISKYFRFLVESFEMLCFRSRFRSRIRKRNSIYKNLKIVLNNFII